MDAAASEQKRTEVGVHAARPVGRRRGDAPTKLWAGTSSSHEQQSTGSGLDGKRMEPPSEERTERTPPSGREKERAGRDFGVKRWRKELKHDRRRRMCVAPVSETKEEREAAEAASGTVGNGGGVA